MTRFLPLTIFLAAAALAQTNALFYRTDYLLDYTPQDGLTGLVVADFNNDGKLDFAIGDGNGIDVALGNGDGTFQSLKKFIPSNDGVGDSALSSAVADFDGDGNVDLVMYSQNGGGILILPGKGDGTFGPARQIASQPAQCNCISIQLIQTADLNHDGHPDLVFLTYSGANPVVSSAIVLLNNGDGAFTSRTGFNLPNNEYAMGVAVADFNRDGTQDLAVYTQVAPAFGPSPAVQGHVYVGLGRGDGSFSSPVPVSALSQPVIFMAVGDFNHDGAPDLAVESGETSILLGNGDGSFRTAPSLNVCCANPGSIAVADWTKTGNLGLGIQSGGPLGIAIEAGNGDGTFDAAGTAAEPLFVDLPEQFVSADLNGDGLPDLVALTIDAVNGGAVSVFLNAGPSPPLGFISTSAASGITAVAPASIASIYGQFPYGAQSSVSVNVGDSAGAVRSAPLFYVSHTQINLEIPAETASGRAVVTVETDGPPVTGTALVQNVVPAIFGESPGGCPAALAITYGPDNQPGPPLVVATSGPNGCSLVPIPRPAGSRVFLELFATGIRNHVSPVLCAVAGGPGFSQNVAPEYAGPQGQFEGLDQINLEITNLPVQPSSSLGGQYTVMLSVDGIVSNAVLFEVE